MRITAPGSLSRSSDRSFLKVSKQNKNQHKVATVDNNTYDSPNESSSPINMSAPPFPTRVSPLANLLPSVVLDIPTTITFFPSNACGLSLSANFVTKLLRVLTIYTAERASTGLRTSLDHHTWASLAVSGSHGRIPPCRILRNEARVDEHLDPPL